MTGVPQKYSRDDLSEKRAAFLDAYLASGGDRTAATHAVMQLYGYPKRQASQYAARLLKDEKIRSILAEEAGTSFAATAWLASERLAEILATGQWFGQVVKPGDGLKAIKDALDRGGFAIAKMVDVRVTDDTKSPQEKLAEVKAMLNQLGGN